MRPRDRAVGGGFTLTEIATQLDGALDGVTGGTILEGTEEVPVRVRIAPKERTTLARIAANSLTPPGDTGQSGNRIIPGVPLNTIAQIDLIPSVANVTHRHGKRVNTISAFLEPYTLPRAPSKEFERRLAESDFTLPSGYHFEYGGESEGSSQAQANLLGVFAPLMVLMVSTLVLAFNSFRMAMIVGSVAFFAVGCGLAAVWAFGHPLGFMAIIGIMGLIGIAINDSIVVLASLRANEEARRGDIAASTEVVMKASRHIISTTLTTIAGFTPLIIWGGNFWPPLAIAVAGGMIGATILALFFVPPFHRLQALRLQRKQVAPVRHRETVAVGVKSDRAI